ncbi:hypothetical protein B0H66DRAFT_579645 [Apodospora peruviana]|uniref:Beta-lactamase superfamily domain-containing protein n=1 Tax=Apodospora peruviana TaxID=516989 RepID=A0AAE0ISG9_9PEZI|nr:hypothetical protein B0H66DRAFT_579645 [Apodospora peruviana]
MALTIKHLNGDASFLLTFESLIPSQAPFRILLDPWITGTSKIFHSKISVTSHKEPACISSLLELPEPDLVIISQNKSDHCNEDTLRQLPSRGTKTVILAEPSSARTIKSWKHFEIGKVHSIPKWEDPRVTGRQGVVRITVPCISPGEPGEVTVAFIPQRRDISGLHAAIGITYRPPVISPSPHQLRGMTSFTPPTTPRSHRSYAQLRPPSLSRPLQGHTTSTHAPPATPRSSTRIALRSARSTSSLATTTRDSRYSPASLASLDRPLSIIYSPHGINYTSLHSYTTSHLIREAALPLTALLHCFDSVCNPWWLGGNVLLGAPAGIETASRLGARAWVSTHDGDKIVKGIATGFLRTRKWRAEDVLGAMNFAEVMWRRGRRMVSAGNGTEIPGSPTDTIMTNTTSATIMEKVRTGTEILTLGIGDEIMLTNVPVLAPVPAPASKPTVHKSVGQTRKETVKKRDGAITDDHGSQNTVDDRPNIHTASGHREHGRAGGAGGEADTPMKLILPPMLAGMHNRNEKGESNFASLGEILTSLHDKESRW